jgi:hypothetical protein
MTDDSSFICVLICRTDLDGVFLLYSDMSSRCTVLEIDRFFFLLFSFVMRLLTLRTRIKVHRAGTARG